MGFQTCDILLQFDNVCGQIEMNDRSLHTGT